jgi:hypothetical protein
VDREGRGKGSQEGRVGPCLLRATEPAHQHTLREPEVEQSQCELVVLHQPAMRSGRRGGASIGSESNKNLLAGEENHENATNQDPR